jgi:hypothetical protein
METIEGAYERGRRDGAEAQDKVWIKYANEIWREGVHTFVNPMLALASKVALEGLSVSHDDAGHSCTVGCPKYNSGHSVDVNGFCNMGCC